MEAYQCFIEQREQFTQQKRDPHAVGLFRLNRQMDISALCLQHMLPRNRKLKARASKESPLAPLMQPGCHIRSCCPQPVEKRGVRHFTREGHDRSRLQWA